MISSKEEIDFIRLLQNQGIHFCPDCHAPTQEPYKFGTYSGHQDLTIYVLACTKCKWGTSLETKSI
jgi:RNase P subunit RPR2